MSVKFSIIMPVYNVEDYVCQSLRSVDAQTFRDFELIMVNDGSTDGSKKICEDFALAHSYSYLVSQKNSGLGAARNTGIRLAKGEYVIFLDSDDFIQPQTLELYNSLISIHDHPDVVASGVQYVDQDSISQPATGSTRPVVYDNVHLLQNDFLKRTKTILVPGTAFSLLWIQENNLRFKSLAYSEDIIFIWEALSRASRAIFIPHTLYNYLQRPGSIMRSMDHKDIVDAYKAYSILDKDLRFQRGASGQTRQFMLSRWVLGTIHAYIRNDHSNSDVRQLMYDLDFDRHAANLRRFPEIKARLVAWIYGLSPYMFRNILRWK